MTTDVAEPVEGTAIAPSADPGFLQRHGGTIEYVLIPGAALAGALAVFGVFVALFGKNPLDLYFYMYYGAFGTWFSWQNTLTRAAPLILTALCTALPAQLGMVIIGGEGALLIGALAATSAALALQSMPPLVVQLAMVVAGMIGGGLVDHAVGGLAAVSRRQRNDLEPAARSISRSRSSIISSKARCAIRRASTSRRRARSARPT